MMKRILLILLSVIPVWGLEGFAQNQVEYYLPKTELRFHIMVEKQVYTPGEFAKYAELYMKKKTSLEGNTEYRLLGVTMQPAAVADTEKHFSLTVDMKHTVFNIERDANGVITAINCKAASGAKLQGSGSKFQGQGSKFQGSRGQGVNPHDFMSQEILAAGSTSKMAELTAHEIYDIRESRNQLSRGEADFMPKDGEQLKIMMQNLDKQEKILMQTFEGVVTRDTADVEVVYTPYPTEADSVENTRKDMLFRFSKWRGVVDTDDVSGVPYYISITNLLTMPDMPDMGVQKKERPYLAFSLPGKIDVSVASLDGKGVYSGEIYASQYGRVEELPQSLFGKKVLTKVQINPVTGYIEKLETEPIE